MTDESREPEGRGAVAALRGLPGWKKIVFGISSLILASGVGLTAYDQLTGVPREAGQRDVAPGADSALVGRSGFLPGEGSGAPGARGEGAEARGVRSTYSPALLKGGLSFFVGFCCGYAVRAFLKVSVIVAGIVLLVIFGLSYAGWVTVEWAAMETQFEGLLTNLKGQAKDFQAFITGSLPSAGMAGLGLFTGVKKS